MGIVEYGLDGSSWIQRPKWESEGRKREKYELEVPQARQNSLCLIFTTQCIWSLSSQIQSHSEDQNLGSTYEYRIAVNKLKNMFSPWDLRHVSKMILNFSQNAIEILEVV
jgi:hypothetical protein